MGFSSSSFDSSSSVRAVVDVAVVDMLVGESDEMIE